jgi:galactose mutarotase-like enzyme
MNIKRKEDHHFALQRAFDTPWPGPQGEPVILENENLRLDVYPQDGARIVSLRAFGFEVLRQWTPQRRAFQYGCFPMVPWVGRLGYATLCLGDETYPLPANKPPHALHGMACYSHWEVDHQTAHSLTLHSVTDSPWPWEAAITQTLALEGETLLLRIEIATPDAVFPAAAGWHPWFVKHLEGNETSEALRLVFSPSWQEEIGNDELPTGRHITPQTGPWDDCFGFTDGVEAT